MTDTDQQQASEARQEREASAYDFAEAWNTAVPVGTRVRYWTGLRKGPGKESITRTVASVLGGHTAVVWVEGKGACIALTHVERIWPNVKPCPHCDGTGESHDD